MMLSKPKAAKRMGISVSTLERLMVDGKIAYYLPSPKCCRFDEDDIQTYMDSVRRVPKSEAVAVVPTRGRLRWVEGMKVV